MSTIRKYSSVAARRTHANGRALPIRLVGINIIGSLPTGKGHTKFVVVAVDYFTKWAEVELLAKITEQKITDFVWKNVICRFKIPQTIISDNEKQLKNKQYHGMCRNLEIRSIYSSLRHPQANRQVEAVNKIIKHHLQTKLEKVKRA
ncbi:uncharacterized protein LOC131248851 [Magnolia sinica]|uniref:uncharacterized protein LOC131248851 n=1 Tax=Magnolia sinica TaxID=86752 RepID=UPI0026590678|nr:uncharacterized protein LOC131248851 [Magnolia sinica]